MANVTAGKKQGKQSKPPRDEKGRFLKGVSGNAGGRKRMPEDVKEAFKSAGMDAFRVLREILLNTEAADRDRIRAAEIILERGYGKPVQAVSMEPNEDGEALGVVVLAPVMEPTKPPEDLPDA